MADVKDLAIVGGGPGGYVAALRAAQLGLSVVLFEEDRVGGTCMNYGCIPAKFLLHETAMFRALRTWKRLEGPAADLRLSWAEVQKGRQAVVDRLVTGTEFLLRKAKVEVVKGRARLKSPTVLVAREGDAVREFEARRVILATGSRSADLPFLKADGRDVVTSREALEFPEVPKDMVVIGAGAIGLETGSTYQRMGCDVTVLEMMPQILPGSDRESASRLERALKKQGLKVLTQMRIESASVEPGRVTVRGTNQRTQKPFEYAAGRVLLAAGRRPNSRDLTEPGGPEIPVGRGGFVEVNAKMETAIPGVYAIGDLVGGKLLAHKAYHEGVVAAENAAGQSRTAEYDALPSAVFTDPEFASVGLGEEEAAERGLAVRTGVFPLQANGRALTMDATDGFVKIVAGPGDVVVGGHVIAPAAGEIVPVLTMAVAKKLTLRDVADLIYVHPTVSEAAGEAALKVENKALHILPT